MAVSSRSKRWAGIAAASVVTLTALVGFGHTKWGRFLFARTGAKCPVMNVSPEKLEASRLERARPLRGNERAKARPVLTFVFGQSSQKDVEAWASGGGGSCKSE